MRFALTSEQVMFADSVRRQFERMFPDSVIKAFADKPSLDSAWTREMAEAGILGLCATEEAGGLGLGAVDALPVLIECGRRCVPFPVAETIVVTALLSRAGHDITASIIDGTDLATLGFTADIKLRKEGGGWIVDASVRPVAWGAQARWMVLRFPQTADAPGAALIDLQGVGVTVTPQQSFDRTVAMAEVTLKDYRLTKADALAHELIVQLYPLLLSAETLGASEVCFEKTTGYVPTREQFGQPIGKYQAIKHILANDALKLESIRVALFYAAWAFDAGAEDRDIARMVTRTYVTEASQGIAEDAIQCHGGIAFTWDYGLHFLVRRILRTNTAFGSKEAIRESLTATLLERVESGRGLHPA